ncbi:MAG: LacI family DNA-binding transcriptional regulator [Alphaproteobacteria bacterium]|nr:LacI family DNA-binding transcriptional regulator [Alphaproteobacteria bacterium]
MATIRDVARAARVSIATVSAVVNRSTFVSSALEGRVRTAIGATGYRPDLRARALKSGAARVLGLLARDLAHAGSAALAQAVAAALQARDYALLLEVSRGEPARARACLDRLRDQRVAGLLLVDGMAGGAGAYRADVPLVQVGGSADEAVDFVGVDHEAAAAAATAHLAGLGHRRIALLAGPATDPATALQLGAYRSELARLGLAFDPRLVRIGPGRPEHAATSLAALLALATPPSAVVVGDAALASGAVGILAERGLRAPRDLSLLSLEDAAWMAPLGLGAGAAKPDRIAAAAIDQLFARIAQPASPARRVAFVPVLDPRRSCAPCPPGR